MQPAHQSCDKTKLSFICVLPYLSHVFPGQKLVANVLLGDCRISYEQKMLSSGYMQIFLVTFLIAIAFDDKCYPRKRKKMCYDIYFFHFSPKIKGVSPFDLRQTLLGFSWRLVNSKHGT